MKREYFITSEKLALVQSTCLFPDSVICEAFCDPFDVCTEIVLDMFFLFDFVTFVCSF